MKLILTDLHMGSPLFRVEDKVINLLRQDWEEIILLGDIYDTWFYPFPELRRLYSVISQLFAEKQTQIRYIVGNHDPSVEEIEQIWPSMVVVHEYALLGNYMLVHGHEFDVLVTKYSCLARVMWNVHRIGAYFGINLKAWGRDLVYSLSSHVGKRYYTKMVGNVQDELVKKYLYGGYEGVICGHTHRVVNYNYPNGFHYINLGDAVHNKTYGTWEDGSVKCVSY